MVGDGAAVLHPVEDAVELTVWLEFRDEGVGALRVVEVDDGGGGLVD